MCLSCQISMREMPRSRPRQNFCSTSRTPVTRRACCFDTRAQGKSRLWGAEEQVLKAIDAETCSCPAFEDCEDDTSTGLDGPAPAPAEGNFVIYMYLPPLLRSSILPAPSKQAQQQLKKAQASGLLEGIVQETLSKFGINARVHRMRPPILLDGGELRAPSGTAKIQDLGLVIAPSPPGRAWVVEAVEQNSWADAFGVRVADRILWINGWPTSAMSPAQLLQWSEHPLTLILD